MQRHLVYHFFLGCCLLLLFSYSGPACDSAYAQSYLSYYYNQEPETVRPDRFRQAAEVLATAVEGTTGALIALVCAIGGIISAACGAGRLARNFGIGLLATIVLRHGVRDFLLADLPSLNGTMLLFLAILGAGGFTWAVSGKKDKDKESKDGAKSKSSYQSITHDLPSGSYE